MKIVLCIEGLFLFFWFYSSYVFVDEGVDVIFDDIRPIKLGSVHFWCIFLGTKKVYKIENQIFVDYSLRRALDSNQRIPYDIGSLANCWFKPLTQPSLNHLFCKRAVQIYYLFWFLQNFTQQNSLNLQY